MSFGIFALFAFLFAAFGFVAGIFFSLWYTSPTRDQEAADRRFAKQYRNDW